MTPFPGRTFFIPTAALLITAGAWPAVNCLPLCAQQATQPEASAGTDSNAPDESEVDDSAWSIESMPGPQHEQPIDVTEGTWQTVDVSPDGRSVVFDLLGDLYLMPITGADGQNGSHPEKLTDGVSWDMQPRFSPDGSEIAFCSDRGGKSQKSGWNIWVLNLKSRESRQITNETFRLLNGPAWSPNGKYIVARKHFTSRRSMGAGEIWMYPSAGADAGAMAGLQLTKRPNDQKDVNEPAYSTDGRYVFYSQDATPGDTFEYDKDSNNQIYVVKRLDLAKGETETLISGPGGACRPVPSPDGRSLAFVRRVGEKTGLHVYDLDSGAVRLVSDRLERDMQEAWAVHGVYPGFAWMPDGRSVVIWARGKIRRIQISNGQESLIPFHVQDRRQITEAIRFPVDVAPDQFDVKMLRWVQVAPDGSSVLYQALGKIYVRDLPDGQPRRLTNRQNEFEFCPSFSRDGRSIVYTTWNDQSLGSIRICARDGANNRAITVRPGHYVNPALSPDGRTVVFEKRGGGLLRSPLYSHDPGIYRIPVSGGQPERISKSGHSPQFSADSDRVFLITADGQKDADNLKLISVDMTGNELRKHFTSKWATSYRISPDGRYVAFIERFNVYVIPFVATGTEIAVGPDFKGLPIRKVTSNAGDWAHFSGDSSKLHWSLGPDLFTCDVAEALQPTAESDQDVIEPESVNIGFRTAHHKPSGRVAFVGARIITMTDQGVIDDGVVITEENRIVAVGARSNIRVPEDAVVINVGGQTILPGFIDTHAHGSQATNDITPQKNWVDYARLAFGVTTIHDPSNNSQHIFAASELTKAGLTIAPRTFSTGRILYGAAGSFKAEIDSLDDARFHLKRMKAIGAFSVKSYNQPRRDQRQQVLAAARELEMMVVPEGGSTFMNNMTMIVDGHTGIEHTLPVQNAYDDVMDLWRGTEVGYTPTLSVAYGGISGEQYWYQVDDLFRHPRLQTFIPPHVLVPRSRRRDKSPLEDYNHIKVAGIAKQVVEDGGLVQAGGHGQLNGICTHWEMWSFVQGGMKPMDALRCGTILGARYIGLDGDLGSIEPGKLADLIVLQKDADPLRNIRDTERVQFTVANGRVFDAATMNEYGDDDAETGFYWATAGNGVSYFVPVSSSCGCTRPGASAAWSLQAP